MTSPRIAFAHPSEEQFAQLLDFYGIPWQYEPHIFELDHHEDGSLKRAFAPDFYLPQSDTYVELTTMSQRQIGRKHRKIRLLQERFPHVRLKLLSRKSLAELWARYGIAPAAWTLA